MQASPKILRGAQRLCAYAGVIPTWEQSNSLGSGRRDVRHGMAQIAHQIPVDSPMNDDAFETRIFCSFVANLRPPLHLPPIRRFIKTNLWSGDNKARMSFNDVVMPEQIFHLVNWCYKNRHFRSSNGHKSFIKSVLTTVNYCYMFGSLNCLTANLPH